MLINAQPTRPDLVNCILEALLNNKASLQQMYQGSGAIKFFFIDDLFSKEIAESISASFPDSGSMRLRRSLREVKFVSAQMDAHPKLLEETIFAFQDQAVVDLIGEITGLRALEPDSLLYAGGISLMEKGHFLNPHIDNSHNKDRTRYRVLNLLYYASRDWKVEYGGNLEVWPSGVKANPTTLYSKFNRLAVMVTDEMSWHSVSPITIDRSRLCISNYYFSKVPVGGNPYFHVTTFRGRPEQPLRDFLLRLDSVIRTVARVFFPSGVVKTKHFYRKKV